MYILKYFIFSWIIYQCYCVRIKKDNESVAKIPETQTYIIEPSDTNLSTDDLNSTIIVPNEDSTATRDGTVPNEIESSETNIPPPEWAFSQGPVNQYSGPPAIPQGPVNQYSGGPYFPPQYYNGYHQNYLMPAHWAQYLSQANIPIGESSMYEGILVPLQTKSPSNPPQQPLIEPAQQIFESVPLEYATERSPNKSPSTKRVETDLVVLLRNILPPNWIYMMANFGSLIMNFFSMVAFGGLITTAICSLTPICSISFGILPAPLRRSLNSFGFNETSDPVAKIARVRRAIELFDSALEKYEKMEKINSKRRSFHK